MATRNKLGHEFADGYEKLTCGDIWRYGEQLADLRGISKTEYSWVNEPQSACDDRPVDDRSDAEAINNVSGKTTTDLREK